MQTENIIGTVTATVTSNEISLRDYFAAKAMHALITEPPWGDGGNASIHTWSAGFLGKDPLARFAYASYKMADAMLAMRESNAKLNGEPERSVGESG